MQIFYQEIIESPLGKLKAIASEEHIYYLYPVKEGEDISKAAGASGLEHIQARYKNCSFVLSSTPLLTQLKKELNQYFSKNLKQFSIPIKLLSSDFSQRVMWELSKVEYGKYISYAKLGQLLGIKGSRCIGQVMSKNKIIILLPCHRVVLSNNSIGQYSCGVESKKYLLDLEGLSPKLQIASGNYSL